MTSSMAKIVAITSVIFMLAACGEREADGLVENVSVEKAYTLIEKTPSLVVLDVRTPEEYNAGHIADAININYRSENFKTWLASADKSKVYLVHCKSGGRSSRAIALMEKAGFNNIQHLNKGFDAWAASGKGVVK